MLSNPQTIVDRLREFQTAVRDSVIDSRRTASAAALHTVSRSSSADTIYAIDTVVDPILVAACEDWAKTTPLVLVAEGLEDADGNEVDWRTFPQGTPQEAAELRVIVDPIDGTRGLMYDKRAAWALAGVAPNKGPATRLRDIEVAVMTELPTSKMGLADVLWAIKGHGAVGRRVDLASKGETPLALAPSKADTLAHGFASISNFFPATKKIAAQTMERIAAALLGPADTTKAMIFDDQYICTGGQFYELIVGHDRFNADLRPIFYRAQGMPPGLCCHPYDCATWLVAEEAGVVLTDGAGRPLDGPMDVTTGLSWAGYANAQLRAIIEPLIMQMLREWGQI